MAVAVADRGRNETLAAILRDVGWSPYELARAVNRALDGERRIHPTTPFTWRDRGVVPRGNLPAVIAGVLTEARGRSVAVTELWPNQQLAHGLYSPATIDLSAQWTARQTVDLLAELPTTLTRRRYFALAGPELVDAARASTTVHKPLRARNCGTGEVTQEFLAYLADDITALRRLDDGHGGQLVLRTASYQLSLAVDLFTESRYGQRQGRQLASLVGQLAQLTGWLHFDLGQHGNAQRLYLLGLRAAGLANDPPLSALLLSSLALLQSWRTRPHDSLALLRLTKSELPATITPRVRALLAIREAHAHATRRDERETYTAINRAQREFHTSTHAADEPTWVYWLDESVISSEIGRCMLRLGQVQPAREHLSRGIGMLGTEPTRDRILYGLSLAHTHIHHTTPQHIDADQACHEASQVLPLMRTITSQRCNQLLTELASDLRRHRTVTVRDFLHHAESTQIHATPNPR